MNLKIPKGRESWNERKRMSNRAEIEGKKNLSTNVRKTVGKEGGIREVIAVFQEETTSHKTVINGQFDVQPTTKPAVNPSCAKV